MPNDSREHVATYQILVDGQAIDAQYRDRIKEIRVVDYLQLPDVCTIQVQFPRADGIDSQPFAIGKPLEIKLGARDELTSETLFKGDVMSLESTFGAGGCVLMVRAFDRAHLLHRTRRARTFQNQTASDIVKAIASEYGLAFDGDPSGEPPDFVQQDNETDWDLAWRLADRCGFEVVVEDKTLYFRRPKTASAVELEWPKTLTSFRPRVTATQQVAEVTLRAHDALTKQTIAASATQPVQVAQIGVARSTVVGAFPESKLHVATEPVKTSAQASTLTQAALDKLANGYVAAEGSGPGNPRIKAGATVEVKGVGTSFSGRYRVASSRHVLRSGGSYVTSFANSAEHTIAGMLGANGSGPPRFGSGLVVGLVTNTNDPEKLGRVRVSYPALGSEYESGWARIATLAAGRERGALMLPVVGEEVLVGFEHGDTTSPYVLGSLFNGRDTPGSILLHDQDGSFVVRSDKQIHTESKEKYTLKSGGPLEVTVDETVDEHVFKTVTEKYDRDWKNKTGGDATLDATGSFTVQGRSLELKGATTVSIEGNASLTLKCGGSQIQLTSAGVTISGPLISLG